MEHASNLIQFLPSDGLKILLVLFLCFLIGLEREEHKTSTSYSFGGVRTYPLIGLLGYALALLSGPQLLPLSLGLLVVGGFMLVSFSHKLHTREGAGVTSEISGLIPYALGALVQHEYYWIATSLVVLSLLLLELKEALEGLSKQLPPEEVLTFTKFLLLAGVILPVVPNQEFTSFLINPFKTWVVVVAVSTVSYGSYVLQKMVRGRGGVLLAAVLGGAYSSTVTTVTLSKLAHDERRPYLFSGCILVASGVMYLRLIVLIGLFNRELMLLLSPAFAILAVLAMLTGWMWSRRADHEPADSKKEAPPKNPLELSAAFLFALIFLLILVVTHLALTYLGHAGVYTLAGIMGMTDVDPFILGMTQVTKTNTPLAVAASAIIIATGSNNLVKGIYAYSFSDRRTGLMSLSFLAGLAILGFLPLVWLL